ncbi:hypothetical protein C9374_006713 [Naegleria lovaniensis]|uniref:Uncharacterized protein n=1 Tax=Naegleria lovaniensis TaxID=51637 RepID=A0AA88GND4_NAELO|nr:uncharacterized protein C9374_006713 [Naegleria lovaniensis]KAG2379596.1 hypothetical protein C9374_006713 [Naegleria lovaniensis]
MLSNKSSSFVSENTSDSSFYKEREESYRDETRGNVTKHTFNVDLTKECPKLEETYKSCFNDWYTNVFLKGKGLENGCRNEWEDVKACMMILVNEKSLEISVEKGEKETEWKIKNFDE